MRLQPDGVPVIFVHPDDVGDLARFKEQAAAAGASVVVSDSVPPGTQLLAPRGITRFEED